MPTAISRAYAEAFGVEVSSAAIGMRANRGHWKRLNHQDKATGKKLLTVDPTADALAEILTNPVSQDKAGGGPGHSQIISPSHEQLLAHADAKLDELAADHKSRSSKLKEQADTIAAEVLETLLRMRGNLKPGEMKDLATALEKASNIQQKAIDQERRMHGMDKEQAAAGAVPITQIAIVVQGGRATQPDASCVIEAEPGSFRDA